MSPEGFTTGFLAKLGPNGNHVWSHAFARGTAPDVAAALPDAIALDSQGNAIVAGFASGSIDVGAGPVVFTALPPPTA